MINIGKKLKNMRLEHNITISVLSTYLNTTPEYISDIESNIIPLKEEDLIKLAKLYNCDVEYFFKTWAPHT